MEELLKKYDYDVVNQPDKIITVSSYLDPYMIDIPSFKHEIVHNGIDKTFFKPTEKKKNKSKKLLAVGRLSEIKSYDTLLRALVALKNEGITPETVLCGDGVKTDEYKTFAQKYKLNVKFTGNINQEKVRNYMQECDIFIHPSKVETFGLVITEAMACGCVPVASNVGGIKDQINHKENGLMFEQGDVSTLVSHIKTLLNDETFYETLKEKAIKSTEQFTIEKSADKTISIYKELLKR
jgi:glycosyltransferase involved in cell wall biosynthesis